MERTAQPLLNSSTFPKGQFSLRRGARTSEPLGRTGFRTSPRGAGPVENSPDNAPHYGHVGLVGANRLAEMFPGSAPVSTYGSADLQSISNLSKPRSSMSDTVISSSVVVMGFPSVNHHWRWASEMVRTVIRAANRGVWFNWFQAMLSDGRRMRIDN